MSSASEDGRRRSKCRQRSGRWATALRLCLTVLTLAQPGAARWPPPAESDGVYGRLHGNTDASLKLGGLISPSGIAASLGASAHYYSLIGVTGDYSESLSAGAEQRRSFSVGTELRPLFLPRWVLGMERGPAWLDLTLDSICVGFGAHFSRDSSPIEDSRGVWMSLGLGMPVFGRADGPWIELRQVRRWPDRQANGPESHNALLVYLSWHEVFQLGSPN